MNPSQLTMIGLTLDIIGAFFLAVEAIKVENLIKLRDRILTPIHLATISPPINFTDEESKQSEKETKSEPDNTDAQSKNKIIVFKSRWDVRSWRFVSVYFLLHLVAGAGLLFFLNAIFDGWPYSVTLFIVKWLSGLSLWIEVLTLLVLLWVGLCLLWMLGELVHIGLTKMSRIIVDLFIFIERKTASGVVGIIGFLLLSTGFLLQMYANYLEI